MRIGVNARCLTNRYIGPGYYTLHLFQQLVLQHAEHQFIFFTDETLHLDLPANASVIVTGKKVKGYFTLKRWMKASLRNALKDLQVDVFVSLDGSAALSSNVPQVIGITDLKSIDHYKGIQSVLFRRFYRKSFLKAGLIITVSEAVKKTISKTFLIPPGRIHIVPKAASGIFQPLEWEQKEQVKQDFTDGKEYFLFSGGFDSTKNLLAALKGFSQFKKWQQSDMKLVIVGDTTNDPGGVRQKIDTFKFREDVVVLGSLGPGELHQVMAASYAFVYPSRVETYGIPVLEAMQSGTAVITSGSIQVEIDKEAVLFVDAGDETGIGNHMIKLYKDEAFRKQLIEKGLAAASLFNWKDSAAKLWQLMGEVAGARMPPEAQQYK